MTNWWNRIIYACWAPWYDGLIRVPLMQRGRQSALELAHVRPTDRVLLVGVGTGADLRLLPAEAGVAGVDLSRPMLARAERRAEDLGRRPLLVMGDAALLPFTDEAFDVCVLNLIVSVVSHPQSCLREAWRVTRAEGRAVVFDKFLPPGQVRPGWGRRLLNVLTRLFGTDINRSWDEMSQGTGWDVLETRSVSSGGAYRVLLLGRRRG